MNREIKFKAWNEKLKCMSKVLELDFQHDAIRCSPGHLPKNRLSDCVLMRYTGLKDKNGVEVYEGDIVKVSFENSSVFCDHGEHIRDINEENIIGFIEMKGGGYVVSSGKTIFYLSLYLFPNFKEKIEIEVIGNIYENPELLK